MHKPHDEQKEYRPNSCRNGCRYNAMMKTMTNVNATTEVDPKSGYQPTADQGTHNTDADISDETGTGAFDNDTCEPASDEADN
jgi:hypothetical protein